MKDKLVYLCIGIALTVLFFVFNEDIYEAMYYSVAFNNGLHNYDVYTPITIITILMAWGGAAVYYYAINSVRWDRWWHWLVMLAVVVLLTPIICYIVNVRMFDENGISMAAEAASFEVFNLVVTAVLFVIASFSMRWWSTNCRHTPIPQ